jgi:hypothetical protein
MAARPDAPWLAFWLASISGLAEPIGAVVALLVLQSTKLPLENVLASVAGVMCMVALLELYPEAIRSLRQPHHSTYNQPPGPSSQGAGLTMEAGGGGAIMGAATTQRHDKRKGSILWGTFTGAAMMVATEWYL